MSFSGYGVILLFISITYYGSSAEERRLNDHIRYFEGLTYNTEQLHTGHVRNKRSTTSGHIYLKFLAHGKRFHLQLERDTSLFSHDFKIEMPDGSLKDHDTSYIYKGRLYGQPDTEVYGSIINGIFAGTIITPSDTYHIEKSEVYFPNRQDFHSVIYKEKDMNLDHERFKRHADLGGCAMNDPYIYEWMEKVQNSAVKKNTKKQHKPHITESDFQHNLYTAESNSDDAKSRFKREVPTASARTRRACSLFLQSDTILWDYMTRSESSKGLGYTPERAREEITSLFGSHVRGLKGIYENAIFTYQDNQGNRLRYTGITFVVRRVKINETKRDCPNGAQTDKNENLFCRTNIDVSNFLNLNSLRNHSEFCLAYIFTYRDFIGGTLGLAWVGAPSRASGGICERWREYNENGRRVWKSLNTGIITLINYGSRVPVKVSTLTFAHEVGHNFGSPHDSGEQCTPYLTKPRDPDGNFIMFSSATSGDRPNNSKFSPCSVGNITRVIDAVMYEKHGKENCFIEPSEQFCGNMIVEEGEICDCGYIDDCGPESCCYGREDKNQCKLKSSSQCSPSQGPCCTQTCQMVEEKEKKLCKRETECAEKAICNGTFPHCPLPVSKKNMTACNDFTQVCIAGVCQGSICQKIGWEQCYMVAPENDKGFDKGKLCFVACKDDKGGDCVSTGDIEALKDPKNSPLFRMLKEHNKTDLKLPPGAPCDNFKGYCDVFQKCRGVDADGPLARLKNLLFSKQTLDTVKNWIVTYWWAVLLMGIGLVVIMGIFIKVCAVHTPSSNPKKPPARRLTLRPSQRHHAPPPGYAVGAGRGGPPHGKGRNRHKQQYAYEMKPSQRV